MSQNVNGTTLTQKEILDQTIELFLCFIPNLMAKAMDFKGKLRLGQTYESRISKMPVTFKMDKSTGFFPGGANSNHARDLNCPIFVTADCQRGAHFDWCHDEQIRDCYEDYSDIAVNAARALADQFMLDLFAKVTVANFTDADGNAYVTPNMSSGSFDTDFLSTLTTKMNEQCGGSSRCLLVNSKVAGTLQSDDVLRSNQFYDQPVEGSPLRMWRNVGGFAEIIEWPNMPTNSDGILGFAFDQRALRFVQGVPDNFGSPELKRQFGIQSIHSYDRMTHSSGMEMVSIGGERYGHGDLDWTLAHLYGVEAGGPELAQAGHLITS